MKISMKPLLDFSIKRKRLVIVIAIIITLGMAAAIPFLDIKADVQTLLPEGDKDLLLFEKYGMPKSDYFIVAVEAEDPYTVEKLTAFYNFIESVLALDDTESAISPFNQVYFVKSGAFFQVNPIAENEKPPVSQEAVEEFRNHLVNNPFTRRLVVSEDGKTMMVLFKHGDIKDYPAYMTQVENLYGPMEKFFEIYSTGFPPFEKEARRYIFRDFSILMSLGILFILIIYYLGFRAFRSVLLPVMVVLMGTLWTVGAMALLKFPVTIVTIVCPPLVLTLGSSYSIHILNQYFSKGDLHTKDGMWIAGAVGHVSKTILMAVGTTIVGFLSLLITSLKQTREFAIVTSIGILSCAILSLLFLPAMLSIYKAPSANQQKSVNDGFITRISAKLASGVYRFRWILLICLAGIFVVFAFTFKYVSHETDYMDYFPEKSKAIQDNLKINKDVGGLNQLYVTFNAPDGEPGYFLDPKVLKPIDDFEKTMRDNPDITYILSFNTYVRELNYIKSGKREIPSGKGLPIFLSRAFKGFAAESPETDVLNRIANDDFSRLTISFNFYDHETGLTLSEADLVLMADEINANLEKYIPEEIQYEFWGTRFLYLTLYKIMNSDLLKSTALALFFIFLITAITFRSVKYGLASLVPMLTGISLNFIFMAITKIPLDMTTIMVSCVAIGIGVDDSIHFIIQFRRQFKISGGDKKQTLIDTMTETGRPIILTSVSIIGGLVLLIFSAFRPVGYFGLLVSTALLTTTIGCLVFLPALLSLKIFKD